MSTKLVAHYRFRDGIAWDVTNNFNHGESNAIRVAGAPYEGVLLDGPLSRIQVRRSKSLSEMQSVRVWMSIHIPAIARTATERAGRYHPLIFIDGVGGIDIDASSGAVKAYLVSGASKSIQSIASPYSKTELLGTAKSPAGLVQNITSDPHWHAIELESDGFGVGRLTVDGYVAKEIYNAPVVESVGEAGITIGGVPSLEDWPYSQWIFGSQTTVKMPSDVYGFGGYIRELKIYKRDLQSIFDCLRDQSKMVGDDRVFVADFVNALLEDGVKPEQLRDRLTELLSLAGDVARQLTENGPGWASGLRGAGQQIFDGIVKGDPNLYRAGIQAGVPIINSGQTPSDRAEVAKRYGAIFAKLPPQFQDPEIVQRVAQALGAKVGG